MPSTPNTWILTGLRRKFSLTDPRPRDVDIHDIAWATAHINRFTGHVGVYSVAEHCVHVTRRVRDLGGSIEEQLVALLHDATEAYCGDASSPLKQAMRHCGDIPSPYDRIEFRIWYAIAEAFDLELDWSHALPAIVKQADHELVRIEAEHLWGNLPPNWGPLVDPVEGAERYAPLRWPGPLACARYLSMFGDLVIARHGEVLR